MKHKQAGAKMIDKREFYHGAALIRLLEDVHCQRVRKHEFGYIVNNAAFVFLKYTTKSRSPWRFSFSGDEVHRLNTLAGQFQKIIVAMICGGDGICAISWREASNLLGNNAGWISAKRKFNEQYAVAGQAGQLHGKVSLSEWPLIALEN